MKYDQAKANILTNNIREVNRAAKNVLTSLQRLQNLMPIKQTILDDLSEDDKEMLDAFRVRYCDLQDSLGGKLFRSLLVLEEEEIGSQIDVLNKIAN